MVFRRNKFQALLKRCVLFFKFAAAGGVVLAAIALCPAPIEGNWWSSYGCGCESHIFVRFEAGKILSHVGHPIPFEWLGNYERVGWGKYKLSFFYGSESVLVRSRVFSVYPQKPLGIICRDPFFVACWSILRQPENEWLDDPRCLSLVIRIVGGEKVYSLAGKTVKEEKLERMFSSLVRKRELVNRPMSIYVPSNDCPARILSAITTNGFESVIHKNQAWINDVHMNHVVVRYVSGDTRYWRDGHSHRSENIEEMFAVPEDGRRAWWTPVSAVFVPAEGAPESLRRILSDTRYGGAVLANHPWCAASDPQSASVVVGQDRSKMTLWLSGSPYTVDEFEERMHGRKTWRTGLNRPLVVFTENAVVPADVAAMLSRVGCPYEARSVELLRRSR